jgi:hypothetical protein
MFKAIIQDFKEYKLHFNEWLFLRRFTLKLWTARKLADMKQRAFNKQYFVILASNNRLIAINNVEVERLKRTPVYSKAQISKISDSLNLLKIQEINKAKNMYSSTKDIETRYEKIIQDLPKQRLLDKRMDGIKLRKQAFYYTPISKNNSMSAFEIYEGKEKYLLYARKYMK